MGSHGRKFRKNSNKYESFLIEKNVGSDYFLSGGVGRTNTIAVESCVKKILLLLL